MALKELAMRGIVWCIWMVGFGMPLALLGLAVGADRLTALGAGLVTAVVLGWPVLLTLGGIDETLSRRRHRR